MMKGLNKIVKLWLPSTIPAILSVFCLCLGLALRLEGQSAPSLHYFYDDLGQLVKVVDSTGTLIEYVYDPIGNILQIKRSTIGTGLAIFAFTPQQGNIGQAVTIQGQGFSTTPTANSAQFNGTAAQVISATANSIVAVVPPGATTGLISVMVGTHRHIIYELHDCSRACYHFAEPQVGAAGCHGPQLQRQRLQLYGSDLCFCASAQPASDFFVITGDRCVRQFR
jgi:YD repeat-containing protein